MIRISRIVAKDRIADLLDLNFVSKITLRQGRQGFKILQFAEWKSISKQIMIQNTLIVL